MIIEYLCSLSSRLGSYMLRSGGCDGLSSVRGVTLVARSTLSNPEILGFVPLSKLWVYILKHV